MVVLGHCPPPRHALARAWHGVSFVRTALRTVTIEPGGFVMQKWKTLCDQMSVAWPKRLTKAA
jgi:hypothetical protein